MARMAEELTGMSVIPPVKRGSLLESSERFFPNTRRFLFGKFADHRECRAPAGGLAVRRTSVPLFLAFNEAQRLLSIVGKFFVFAQRVGVGMRHDALQQPAHIAIGPTITGKQRPPMNRDF